MGVSRLRAAGRNVRNYHTLADHAIPDLACFPSLPLMQVQRLSSQSTVTRGLLAFLLEHCHQRQATMDATVVVVMPFTLHVSRFLLQRLP